jgi:hypothetical protein
MRKRSLFALALAAAAVSPVVANQAFATLLYNPVVATVGDGTNTSGGLTTSDYLYANSIANQASPISSASYNSSTNGVRLVNSVTATSEASLTNNPGVSNAAAAGVSYSGTAYVYNAGYDAADGTASVNSTATNANRSLGDMVVTASSVSSPTVLKTQTQATAYNNNNIRGATGDDLGAGASLYSAGTGSTATTAGWRNFNTNSQLSTTPTNVRTVELLGGKLFGSTGSGSSVGIYLIDPTGATAATPFVTTGTSSDHSPYEFALFDNPTNTNAIDGYNVAYINDDGAAGVASGGIEKWTYNGSAWTQAYILRDTTTTYYRGLAGELDASTGLVTLFASTSDGTRLQQVTDTGAGSTFTTLATAPTNDFFRGVALAPAAVPEPASLTLLTLGCVSLVARRRK